MVSQTRTHNDYTVGWVCALPKEQTAAVAMLDQRHADLSKPPNDFNTYILGSIGNHNIVIACLPNAKIGTVMAGVVATQMVNAFPSIKFGLMVGIGGGVPLKVRLGDIVVSTPTGQYPGVVQWDFGKAEKEGKFTRTGSLNNPPSLLLSAVARLRTDHELIGSKIPDYLNEMVSKYPRLAPKYLRSDSFQDVRFKAAYDHNESMPDQVNAHPSQEDEEEEGEDEEEEVEEEENCQYCDKTQAIQGKPRDMLVHYGLIASGNKVIKNATFRDKLRRDLGGDVLCVEMEAAGLMDNFPSIVIRGICDYADSHKNKVWQEHAAALAAAYAKELLGYIQPSDVDKEQAVKDILTGISSTISSIKENVTHTRSHLDKKEDLEILDWLSPTDYGPQQTDYLRRRQPGTGQWLLDSVEYQNWIKEPNKTLYCPGIPGAGKTTMTSIVVEDLEKRLGNKSATAVAYVYCNYNRQGEQTLEGLLSSLLKQLAESQPALPHSLKELYDQHKRKRTRPSLDEVSNGLESVAAQNSRIFIIADALDECQALHDCRTKFLSAILNLRMKTHANIFVTSRPIPEIIDHFRGDSSIEIRATENDIRRYLCGHLSELPKVVATRPNLQDEITTSITNAVDGMFLLAQLHFTSLIGKDTPKAIREALQKLATGSNAYDEAYESAIKRIKAQPQEQARRAEQVLSWIICAKRPLTKQELRHALAVEPDTLELDEDNLPEIEDVVSVCAGLVTVDEESSIVRLVHYTTQEYFARTQSEWFPNAQLSIVRACTTYLSYRDFNSGRSRFESHFKGRLEFYPLYDYAAQNWGYHGREVSICEDVKFFLQQEGQVEAAGQALLLSGSRYVLTRWITKCTGLHLAAWFGLNEVIATIFGDWNMDVIDHIGRTPLSWAAENGQEATVKLLLATEGVNPDSKDEFGQTPLSWAAEKGHEDIVKLLLATEGVNPDSKDEVDPNSNDGYGRTLLSWAARYRHEAVVELLKKSGGWYYGTALG
ncbi:hypothetical protein F5Y12DRAFT_793229 [Xylaria sp. FL1777]|nr:hypothetical protein F5Y12DRAFT_793229 [Xylaria sp. FL1777]